MIPKFLSPEVVPFVEILLSGLDAPVRQVICGACLIVLRDGAPPALRGLCPACFDRAVA